MKKYGQITTVGVLAGSLLLGNCVTNPVTGEREVLQNTVKGTAIGAAGGALVGALIGNNRSGGQSRKGAVIGALSGAAIGAGIGQYMDYQEAQIREEVDGSGITVSRDGEDILLNMPSDITFNTNQSSLMPQFQSTLDSVVSVVQKYNKTQLSIVGHTDSDGSESYNQSLSEARAQSVASYLRSRSVSGSRLSTYGRGESQPVASNATASGKAQNRRVEVRVVPQSEQF